MCHCGIEPFDVDVQFCAVKALRPRLHGFLLRVQTLVEEIICT